MKRRMPLGSREVPLQRSAIARVSKKRTKLNTQRRASESELGREALCGTCARCGQYGYVNGHERLARSQGGNPAHPDCLLCVTCNTWCEEYPRFAAFDGWKISSKHKAFYMLAANEALARDRSIFTFGVTTEQADL